MDELIYGFGIQNLDEPLEVINRHEGYAIRIHAGKQNLFLCIQSGYHDYNSFAGTITCGGVALVIDLNSTDDFIKTLFKSPPIDEWCDGVEKCLQFSHRELIIEFSWAVDEMSSMLRYIIIEKNVTTNSQAKARYSRSGKRGQAT